MLDPQLIAELAALGLTTGLLAGLLGIGGGMLMGPILTIILSARGVPVDLAVKMAIATSMATIVFTSLSSVRAHHRRGAVRWDIVRSLAPGIVLGAALASLGVFTLLKGSTLAVLFGLFIGFSALRMSAEQTSGSNRQMPAPAVQIAAGSVIGFLSGLVGAGGAFVSVPFMVAHNVPMIQAVATSAALGFPIAVANSVGYVATGYARTDLPPHAMGFVWLPALAVIACCSVLTAPLGARLAHRLPVARLRKTFAMVLLSLAAYMLYKGLLG